MSGSVFAEFGFKATIAGLLEEMVNLYHEDEIPWVVGYSGGKDSTAVLQLVWLALEQIPDEERHKKVYVISTDTLVENPIVTLWVSKSLDVMRKAAQESGLPIEPHNLKPNVADTFWVNLIGRGYPAPRPMFRWCTERLKIRPSNNFIANVVKENGEAILVLGTRKAESTKRAAVMNKLEKKRVRDGLSPNKNLPNSLVYSPIEDWSNDDVWTFLMQVSNRWGINNKDLLTMYQGASADGECPLVVDSSTPSCGDSRFGCWVCTLVEKDKSMSAMIQNDQEKEWMLPLLELRNDLDVKNDKHLRDFRRMTGKVQLFHDEPIHGPYTQEVRAEWLRRVLEAQQWIREHGPEHVRDIELITMEELREIRRLWIVEKHEVEDLLPQVYQEQMGAPFPDGSFDEGFGLSSQDMKLLEEICDDQLRYQLVRELLDIEKQYRTMARRAGLFEALDEAFERGFYDNKEDATNRARLRKQLMDQAKDGVYEPQIALQLPSIDA